MGAFIPDDTISKKREEKGKENPFKTGNNLPIGTTLDSMTRGRGGMEKVVHEKGLWGEKFTKMH